MKTISFITVLFLFCGFTTNNLLAQSGNDNTDYVQEKTYIITTYNGGEFIGHIIKQDDKEIVIETKDRGRISIPKYEIKEIREVKENEISKRGDFKPDELFSTRYFLTTNALSMEKGDNYVLWTLYGPEAHFGVAKNFSLGVMTTWLGMPIVGSAKYTLKLGEEVNLGLGVLAGTGSWAAPTFGLGVSYAALTIGNRKANINFSAGYGFFTNNNKSSGNPVFSIAGMAKVGKKISIVFDSFYIPDVTSKRSYNYHTNTYKTTNYPFIILIPGIRVQGENNKAFQFGFAGISVEAEFAPFPIPFLGWFRKF